MTKILSGKEVSKDLTIEIKKEIEDLSLKPTLAIVRIGENPSDLAYEKGIMKKADSIGASVKQCVLPEDITTDELLRYIDGINADDSIHGVLMFRPLPKHLDEKAICNRLNPAKDIDGITEISLAGVFSGEKKGYPPCTAQATIEILRYYGVDMAGKKAVVVGRSLVIGKPAMMLLIRENSTVSVCHSKTKDSDLIDLCKNADIIISATGKINTLTDKHFTVNQTIIDVGINFDEEGQMVGDVNYNEALGKVKAITPVPGGVGTVTTTILMKHLVEAAKKAI